MEGQGEMKSTKKRTRSSNWDEEEKKVLRQLVMDKIDVIENKDCSTNTNAQKKAAWQEILSSFNSLNSKTRDMTQLITQWRNTKGHIKSRESEYRRARLITGGGPPPPSPPQADMEIIQAIPNEFVVDSNEFDSDGLFLKSMKQSDMMHIKDVQAECEVSVPILASINDDDYEKSDKLTKPQAESTPLASTPQASTSECTINNKNIRRKLYKPINKHTKKVDKDYEDQLFLLTKKFKENKEQREVEEHKKRMIILDLEQQYWEKKLKTVS